MSDFKAKMYQIQFRLGLRPTPRVYSAPPDPLAGLRGLLLREWEGTGRGGEGEEGRGGDETPPLHAPLIHVSGYAPDFGANNRPTKFQRSASSTFAALSC